MGVISRYFPVERDIRQCKSVSALLYIIQTEAMVQAIHDSGTLDDIIWAKSM